MNKNLKLMVLLIGVVGISIGIYAGDYDFIPSFIYLGFALFFLFIAIYSLDKWLKSNTAESSNNEVKRNILSKKGRLSILISVIWFMAISIYSANEFYDAREIFVNISLYGILPLVLIWGVWWVRKGN